MTFPKILPPVSASPSPASLDAMGQAVASRIQAAGGRAWLVGGAVRDRLRGLPLHDLDFEVYGLPVERLREVLSGPWGVDEVGKAFGVFKLKGWPIDVALPRTERVVGPKHQDFVIVGDPYLDPAVAASRRDFTVNAMLLDPLTGELLDPCGGQADLRDRVLRPCSAAFSEDALRVLRGMQLAARLQFGVHPETIRLARALTPEALPVERVFEEWRKLLVSGLEPSRGLRFLQEASWLQWYPELAALVGCAQDPGWHPEGDVWVHTLHVLDAAAQRRIGDPTEDLVVGLACLAHDFGKPATTFTDPATGRVRSPGHEAEGEAPTRSFLDRLTREKFWAEAVVPLVLHHLRPSELYRAQASDAAVRRLARRVGRIDRLLRVAEADHAGRPPLPPESPAIPWLRERAARLEVVERPPQAIVMGRHLIALGLAPGPRFKAILESCLEAQLDGTFVDLEGGLAFLAGELSREEGG